MIRVGEEEHRLPSNSLTGNQGSNIVAGAKIVADDENSALFLKIHNSTEERQRVGKISIDGTEIVKECARKTISSGRSRRYCIDLTESDLSFSREDDDPHIIKIETNKNEKGGRVESLQCLSYVLEPTLANEQVVDIDVSSTTLNMSNGINLELDSNVNRLEIDVKVIITSRKLDLKTSKKINLKDLSPSETAEIIIKPNSTLKKGIPLTVQIRGSTLFGRINERYRFQKKGLVNGSWERSDTKIMTELMDEPDIKTQVEAVETTEWTVSK
jgi:hypothetical protein